MVEFPLTLSRLTRRQWLFGAAAATAAGGLALATDAVTLGAHHLVVERVEVRLAPPRTSGRLLDCSAERFSLWIVQRTDHQIGSLPYQRISARRCRAYWGLCQPPLCRWKSSPGGAECRTLFRSSIGLARSARCVCGAG